MSNNNELHNNSPFNVYTNSLDVSFGNFDFTITLYQNTPDRTNKLGIFTLSPEHAKAVSHILNENVKQFERMFGEIPLLPPEEIEKLQQEGKFKLDERVNYE